MKTEQIEGNKLIRNFYHDTEIDGTGSLIHYHNEPGMLWYVVEKIEAIRHKDYGFFTVNIRDKDCTIFSQERKHSSIGKVHYISDLVTQYPTKLESTWHNVVAFIKFYNEHLKDKS